MVAPAIRALDADDDYARINLLALRNPSVINMIDVVAMANEHGLPVTPTIRPAVGEGGVYLERPLRRPFALAGIGIILAMTTLFVRPPVWVSRCPRWLGRSESFANEARWMV